MHCDGSGYRNVMDNEGRIARIKCDGCRYCKRKNGKK